MMRQTRGAISFLLAEYRAVLKKSLMSITVGMILSGNYAVAGQSIVDEEILFTEKDNIFTESKDFESGVGVASGASLILNDGTYTASKLNVYSESSSPNTSGEASPGELSIDNALLEIKKNKEDNYQAAVIYGKLNAVNSSITSHEYDGSLAHINFYGGDADADFAGDVFINGHVNFVKSDYENASPNILIDGIYEDDSGTPIFTNLNLNIAGEFNLAGDSQLTIKGYDKGENGATDNFITKIDIGQDLWLEDNSKVIIDHNAIVNVADELGIESTSSVTVQNGGALKTNSIVFDQGNGSVIVADGSSLTVTGSGERADSYGSSGFLVVTKEGDELSTREGLIKVTGNSNVIISHKDAVDYEGYVSYIPDEDPECSDTYNIYFTDKAFDIDSSSTLTISDLGEMTLAEVKALKEKLLLNGTGTLAGYTIASSETIDGAVTAEEAEEYDGTTFLENTVVTNVSEALTGAKNWGSAILDKSNSGPMLISEDSTVKLSYADGNENKFVTNSDGTIANVSLKGGATLALSGTGAIGNIEGSNGVLVAENGYVTSGTVDVGKISIEEGNLNAQSIALNSTDETSTVSNSIINVKNDMTVNNMIFKNANVGIGGKLTVNGELVADPTYIVANDGINFGESGELYVLKDTVIVNGAQVSEVSSSLSSNLILNKQLNLSENNKVYLNGDIDNDSLDKDDARKVVTIGNNANLVITGAAFADAGENAVLSTSSYEVRDGGQITLADVKVSKDSNFKIFENGGDNLDSDKVKVANALYSTTFSEGTVILDVKDNASSLLSGVSSQTRNAILARANKTNVDSNFFDSSENSGLGFVSAALEGSNIANSLNSFTGIAFAAYAPQNALMSSRAGIEAVEQYNGFMSQVDGSIGDVHGRDVSIWVTPLYKRSSSDSFDIEGSKYGANSDLYGLALGADFAIAEGWRLGVDFNVGTGTSDSRGDISYTENDYDFFGFGLYGIYTYNKFSLLTDIGYTIVSNDIEQNSIKTLESDFDSQVLTIGINGKYEFNTSVLDITPHIGIRYFRTEIDSYSVNSNGIEYLHGNSISGDLFEFPIGVSFSRNFINNGWTIRPILDLSIIPVTGDNNLTANINVDGLGELSTKAEIADSVGFNGTIGINAKNETGTCDFGIGYGFTGSKNEESHKVIASFSYSF